MRRFCGIPVTIPLLGLAGQGGLLTSRFGAGDSTADGSPQTTGGQQ